MAQKTVTEIPANPLLGDLRKRKRKLRVAAYCRVSTEEEEQQNSFEVQVAYYTDKITHHEGWQLAGIFADDGISGVSTKKREQFNKMIELCRKKKIDLILTKSISRFARNTLDCIKHVRILKSWGIPVIFEKENIDTSNMNSEMILTCLSSFAQAESESISGNVTKGIRMGYRQGRFCFRYKNFLGYRKGPDGEPEIVPEEAKIIRLIAQNYLNGDSLRTIKETLESMGIPTATGNQNWSTEAIQRILQNEKYMGDVLLQKTYTADFMEGKIKKNNGELPQYYIKDNHPAIIPREMFYQIQEEIARRKSKKPANAKKAKTNRGRFTSKYALSERLVCGNCGCYFRRVTWSIHGRKQIVWRCINRLECGPKVCKDSPSLKEDELYSAILKAIRSLVQGHQEEMAATLQDALIHCIDGENAAIKQKGAVPMNPKSIHLNPSEWHVMEFLWAHGPATGRQAADHLTEKLGWSRSTTLTLLRRLEGKGAVASDAETGLKTFRPLVGREEAVLQETEDFLDRVYQGSLSLMVSALTKQQALPQEEIDALYAMLQEMEGERHDGMDP